MGLVMDDEIVDSCPDGDGSALVVDQEAPVRSPSSRMINADDLSSSLSYRTDDSPYSTSDRPSVVQQRRQSFDKTRTTRQEEEEQEGPRFVGSLDDFHMRQKAYRDDQKRKRGQAAKQLHEFRNSPMATTNTTALSPTNSTRPHSNESRVLSTDHSAADRAAAAAYLALRDRTSGAQRMGAPLRVDVSSRTTPRHVVMTVPAGSVKARVATVSEAIARASASSDRDDDVAFSPTTTTSNEALLPRTDAADRAAAAAYLAMMQSHHFVNRRTSPSQKVVMAHPMRGISYDKTIPTTPVAARTVTYWSNLTTPSFIDSHHGHPIPKPDPSAEVLYKRRSSVRASRFTFESKDTRELSGDNDDDGYVPTCDTPESVDVTATKSESDECSRGDSDSVQAFTGVTAYVPALWDSDDNSMDDDGLLERVAVPERPSTFEKNKAVVPQSDSSNATVDPALDESGISDTLDGPHDTTLGFNTYTPALWDVDEADMTLPAMNNRTEAAVTTEDLAVTEASSSVDALSANVRASEPESRSDDEVDEQGVATAKKAEVSPTSEALPADEETCEGAIDSQKKITEAVSSISTSDTWTDTVLHQPGVVSGSRDDGLNDHQSDVINSDDIHDLSTVTEGDENDMSRDASSLLISKRKIAEPLQCHQSTFVGEPHSHCRIEDATDAEILQPTAESPTSSVYDNDCERALVAPSNELPPDRSNDLRYSNGGEGTKGEEYSPIDVRALSSSTIDDLEGISVPFTSAEAESNDEVGQGPSVQLYRESSAGSTGQSEIHATSPSCYGVGTFRSPDSMTPPTIPPEESQVEKREYDELRMPALAPSSGAIQLEDESVLVSNPEPADEIMRSSKVETLSIHPGKSSIPQVSLADEPEGLQKCRQRTENESKRFLGPELSGGMKPSSAREPVLIDLSSSPDHRSADQTVPFVEDRATSALLADAVLDVPAKRLSGKIDLAGDNAIQSDSRLVGSLGNEQCVGKTQNIGRIGYHLSDTPIDQQNGFIDEVPVICAPSAVSTHEPVAQQSAFDNSSPGLVNYRSVDYRGFVFAVHEKYGIMLLHCTRKKSKGPHFQLPGGHVDEPEFLAAARSASDYETQLTTAARMGAARELFEETGLDVRNSLDRLKPAMLRPSAMKDKNGQTEIRCELKKRLYFCLRICDDDFWLKDKALKDPKTRLTAAMGEDGRNLMLKLSVEHSGFIFEKSATRSVELLKVHSGGNGSKAILLALRSGSIELPNDNVRGSTAVAFVNKLPSTAATSIPKSPQVLVDYKRNDYRGFVFVVHATYGLMLLHCTRKLEKGPHFQLPGGHVDEPEFMSAAFVASDYKTQLLIAARMGAARELYEETGLDFRDDLDRLSPAGLRDRETTDESGDPLLKCELAKRIYFFVHVTDSDFVLTSKEKSDAGESALMGPMDEAGAHLSLTLSHEHSGFRFEEVPTVSAELLQKHSGGHGSRALLMAMNLGSKFPGTTEESDTSMERSIPPHDLLGRPKRESGFFECIFGFCNP